MACWQSALPLAGEPRLVASDHEPSLPAGTTRGPARRGRLWSHSSRPSPPGYSPACPPSPCLAVPLPPTVFLSSGSPSHPPPRCPPTPAISLDHKLLPPIPRRI